MARSRRKHAALPREDILHPTPERLRRGGVERLPQPIADEAGRPARPYRAADTLLQMERRNTITPAMRQAGEDFRALFHLAHLDPLHAADLHRRPREARETTLSDRRQEARRKVYAAMTALGGIASPAGSCIWHVIGCEWTVKEWALREGWSGRPLKQETAAGILVGALGVLQALYGL